MSSTSKYDGSRAASRRIGTAAPGSSEAGASLGAANGEHEGGSQPAQVCRRALGQFEPNSLSPEDPASAARRSPRSPLLSSPRFRRSQRARPSSCLLAAVDVLAALGSSHQSHHGYER